MRALHLFFRLHRPFELKTPDDFGQGYFGGEAEFREAERTEYQPFFALIERNTQRYKDLKVTLAVTGPWLEQAEKWSPELIRRIRRLANLGQVEVVAGPYDHSLASFYDKAEFAAQVEQFQKKALALLNVDCQTLCLPELIYHDKLAKWAEEAGFKVILAGEADRILKHRSANYPYLAEGCAELEVLFQNTTLSRAVRLGKHEVMTEEMEEVSEDVAEVRAEAAEESRAVSAEDFVRGMVGKAQTEHVSARVVAKPGLKATGKWRFSAKKLQKQLDLACLRGNLVNLYLDTGIFREFREAGIVAMFDEFFQNWLKVPGNRFVMAREVPELKLVRPAVSVKTTVNWRSELPRKAEEGLAVLKDVRFCPPEWLRERKQVRLEQDLYGLRAGVFASGDSDLKRDFGRLTAVDYLLLFGVEVPVLVGAKTTKLEATLPESFEAALVDLRARTPILKLAEHGSEAGEAKTAAEEVPHGKYLPDEDHTVVVHRVKREEMPVEEVDEELTEEPEGTVSDFDTDDFEMDEWQEAMSSAADDVEAELQIMMQRMSRAKEQATREVDELEEAEVVDVAEPEAEETKTAKKVRKKLVIE